MEYVVLYDITKSACLLERDNRDDDAREHWVDIFGPAFADAPAAARPDTSLPGAAPWRAPPPPLVARISAIVPIRRRCEVSG